AEEIGLNMVFDNIVHTNTFHAHRLVKYASEHNKALPLIDLLFNSYFSWNENIGESHVLQRLAEQAGLLKGEVDTLLCLNTYAKRVKLDEQLAEEIGISTAPFFIFNEEYALSGLQPVHIFTDILNELGQEEQKLDEKSKHASERSYCTGENCDREKRATIAVIIFMSRMITNYSAFFICSDFVLNISLNYIAFQMFNCYTINCGLIDNESHSYLDLFLFNNDSK